MAYHHDLLRQAFDLADKPTQADLRRSVSAAYYALFHLLIHETVRHWSLDSSRGGLSRMFEHRVMAKASERVLDSRLHPYSGEDPAVVQKLKAVARSFGQLQEERHTADYDNATDWTWVDAFFAAALAAIAFKDWKAIRGETIAQEYLVSLLIKPRN